MSIDEKATAVVAEMAELGAIFTISDAGPTGEPRWHWRPDPEVMRGAIRKFWASVPDRGAPGFTAAMIRAIVAKAKADAELEARSMGVP